MKVNKALAMRCRNRHRLTKSQLPRFGQTGGTGLSLAFVGQKDHERAGTPDLVGKELVSRRYTGAGIDDHHRHIGKLNGAFSLLAHAVLETAGRRLFQAGRVDDPEFQSGKRSIALAPVTCYAWLVIDNGMLTTDQPVEQRRFADIRPAHDGDSYRHTEWPMAKDVVPKLVVGAGGASTYSTAISVPFRPTRNILPPAICGGVRIS